MGLKRRAGLRSGLQPPAAALAAVRGRSPSAGDKPGLCVTATDCAPPCAFERQRWVTFDFIGVTVFFHLLIAVRVVCGWHCLILVLFCLCVGGVPPACLVRIAIVLLLWTSWCVTGCIPEAHLLEQLILMPCSGFFFFSQIICSAFLSCSL